jgi:Domain of unknown function (DUF4184)
MPFTLAHPAAILPLRGIRYLRTAPLVIGALVPDLAYYVPGRIGRHLIDNHTFRGSVTTDLAIGYLALALLFVLRRPLTALLSVRARSLCLAALAPFSAGAREWALAPIAIVIGVWTHLLWDSFTHGDGWVVHRVAALSAPVSIGPYTGTVYHVLQYLSSVFGLCVLAVWYHALPAPAATPAARATAHSSTTPILMLVAAAAVLIGSVQATVYFAHTQNVYGTINILLTHGLTWLAVLYLVAGIIVTLQESHERQADSCT